MAVHEGISLHCENFKYTRYILIEYNKVKTKHWEKPIHDRTVICNMICNITVFPFLLVIISKRVVVKIQIADQHTQQNCDLRRFSRVDLCLVDFTPAARLQSVIWV